MARRRPLDQATSNTSSISTGIPSFFALSCRQVRTDTPVNPRLMSPYREHAAEVHVVAATHGIHVGTERAYHHFPRWLPPSTRIVSPVTRGASVT